MTLDLRTADKAALSQLFDEINLNRLGLISMQSRVGATTHSWDDEYLDGDRPVRIKCVGTTEYAIPHGIDNDIMIGIENMFLAAGCPHSNAVTGTANTFLRFAGLDTSGRYHKNLKQSLLRLTHANFHIERNWHDGQRFRTVIFRHLHEIAFDTPEEGGSFDRESRITVILPATIAESIRRGYIKPLNAKLLRDVTQPSTRALYRLLDGHRHAPDRAQEKISILQVNLIDWARKARILDLRPDKIRRTLDSAHAELLKARYLSDVSYTGRGGSTNVTYVFAAELELADPELSDRLAAKGITKRGIESLITAFGPATVRERLTQAEQQAKTAYKPLTAGWYVNFIREPEKYVSRVRTPSNQPVLLQLPATPPEDPDEQARRQWDALTPLERARDAVRTVKVAYGNRLSAAQYETLKEAVEVGAIDGWTLRAEAGRALQTLNQDQGAAHLIERLTGLTKQS